MASRSHTSDQPFSGSRPPGVPRLLETALFVSDLAVSCAFYHQVLGFRQEHLNERGSLFELPGGQILLLIRQGVTHQPHRTRGGVIPPCGTTGASHLAFAVEREELEAWEAHLAAHGVEVQSRVDWERGGRSLYFRDPEGHLLELASPGVWEIY